MKNKKRSLIWTVDKNILQDLLDKSCSKVEILQSLGFDGYNGNHRTLKERLATENFNFIKFNKNKELARKIHLSQLSKNSKIPLELVLVENSKYKSSSFRKRLIDEKILDYECEKCKNNGNWFNEKLTLQLEHKNGNHYDNRLENLCFLCPNCHSQTPTFGGKNMLSNRNKLCETCGNRTKGYGKNCSKCYAKTIPLKFEVAKEDLQVLVKTLPFTTIGKMFGVSDNAIRKRCNRLGIEIKVKK